MCLDTVTNMNETLNTITGYNSDAAIDLGYEKNVHNCYFHNCYLPISSNLLKKSFSKSSLFVLTKTAVMGKVFCQLYISSYYCNSCNQNPWNISFKKFSFINECLETFCKYINRGFKPQI